MISGRAGGRYGATGIELMRQAMKLTAEKCSVEIWLSDAFLDRLESLLEADEVPGDTELYTTLLELLMLAGEHQAYA